MSTRPEPSFLFFFSPLCHFLKTSIQLSILFSGRSLFLVEKMMERKDRKIHDGEMTSILHITYPDVIQASNQASNQAFWPSSDLTFRIGHLKTWVFLRRIRPFLTGQMFSFPYRIVQTGAARLICVDRQSSRKGLSNSQGLDSVAGGCSFGIQSNRQTHEMLSRSAKGFLIVHARYVAVTSCIPARAL